MNTAQLRQWLAAGKTDRVLDAMLRTTATEDTDLHQEATLLSARFENLASEKRRGTLEFEDEARELAHINHALLEIVIRLEKGPQTVGTPAWVKTAAIIAVVVGLLAGTAYTLGIFEEKTVLDPVAQTPDTDTAAIHPAAQPAQPQSQPAGIQAEPQKLPAQKPAKSKTSGSEPSVPTSPAPQSSEQARQKTETAQPSGPDLRPLPPPAEALTIGCKTNKGRGSVYYRAGQDMRFYFTVNLPCYIRAIYKMADGRLVLLADDRQVSAAQTGQWIEIGPGLGVAEPFGDERVYVFAQTTPFSALATRGDAAGNVFITDGLPEALAKTRAFKRKQVYAENDVMFRTTR
ncbi:MAG: hypothetical protein ACKVU2_14645 [Saprospiraceae bacterium]